MKKFKDLPEAQLEYAALEASKKTVEVELLAEKKAHAKTKIDLEKEKADHAETQTAAKEAIEIFNKSGEDKSKVTVTVKGVKYEVLFGVDGLTKEQLSKDTEKLSFMIEKGSGALLNLEDK